MFGQLKDLMATYRLVLYSVGESLNRWKEERLWEDEIGEGINTYYDFLSMPEVGLSTRDANMLISMYSLLNEVGQDPTKIPIENLKHMVRTNRGITQDMLDAAGQLSPKDFKERYHDIVEEVDNGTRTYTYMVMRRCNETGNLEKVYGLESEEVLQAFNDKIDG